MFQKVYGQSLKYFFSQVGMHIILLLQVPYLQNFAQVNKTQIFVCFNKKKKCVLTGLFTASRVPTKWDVLSSNFFLE